LLEDGDDLAVGELGFFHKRLLGLTV